MQRYVVILMSLSFFTSDVVCMRGRSFERCFFAACRVVRLSAQYYDYDNREIKKSPFSSQSSVSPYEFKRHDKFYKSLQGENLSGVSYYCLGDLQDPVCFGGTCCERIQIKTLYSSLLEEGLANFCFYDELEESLQKNIIDANCDHVNKIIQSTIRNKSSGVLLENFYLCLSLPCGCVTCAICACDFVNKYNMCPSCFASFCL